MHVSWYLDAISLEVRCPSCRHPMRESAGVLKDGPHMQCPGCQQRILVDGTELKAALLAAAKQVDAIERSIQDSIRTRLA